MKENIPPANWVVLVPSIVPKERNVVPPEWLAHGRYSHRNEATQVAFQVLLTEPLLFHVVVIHENMESLANEHFGTLYTRTQDGNNTFAPRFKTETVRMQPPDKKWAFDNYVSGE